MNNLKYNKLKNLIELIEELIIKNCREMEKLKQFYEYVFDELRGANLLPSSHIEKIKNEWRQNPTLNPERILLEKGCLEKEKLLEILFKASKKFNEIFKEYIHFEGITTLEIQEVANFYDEIKKFPQQILRKYKILPIEKKQNFIVLATYLPRTKKEESEIKNVLGITEWEIKWKITLECILLPVLSNILPFYQTLLEIYGIFEEDDLVEELIRQKEQLYKVISEFLIHIQTIISQNIMCFGVLETTGALLKVADILRINNRKLFRYNMHLFCKLPLMTFPPLLWLLSFPQNLKEENILQFYSAKNETEMDKVFFMTFKKFQETCKLMTNLLEWKIGAIKNLFLYGCSSIIYNFICEKIKPWNKVFIVNSKFSNLNSTRIFKLSTVIQKLNEKRIMYSFVEYNDIEHLTLNETSVILIGGALICSDGIIVESGTKELINKISSIKNINYEIFKLVVTGPFKFWYERHLPLETIKQYIKEPYEILPFHDIDYLLIG